MITITMLHTEPNITDTINYIDHIAMLIAQGYEKGDGWELINDHKPEEKHDDNETDESEEEVEGLYPETERVQE